MTADDLRTRLKALVEEWRWNARNERIGWPEAAGLLYAADRLEDAILNSPEIPDGCADLLAESEPAKPEAKLPLGHPYSAFVDGDDGRQCSAVVEAEVRDGGASLGSGLTVCGQPSSAHEPK